jgi:ATP-binding cassette subfamily B protein
VRFQGVDFGYGEGRAVLQEIELEVAPGECLGIAGETGAGKSTLLALVARFYDVHRGAVRVDGVDVRQLHLDDLRRNLGVVFQESFLFSNTVAANIAFGEPDASQPDIERAARLAAAHRFIRELPDGYDTVVGEHGSNLSGGQRQRLALARALLLDPPILLLDDPLAAVDPETEHEIRAAIDRVMRERTTFLVSNRISSLRRADRVVVLERGRIVQEGPPAELLRVPGAFRRLAELQSYAAREVCRA